MLFNERFRMSKEMKLSEMKPGMKGYIVSLSEGSDLRDRLEDLGFVVGMAVDCVERSPLGNPSAYRVCDTVIALQAGDADVVTVRTAA